MDPLHSIWRWLQALLAWPIIQTTDFAVNGGLLQSDYDACWSGFPKARLP